MAFARDRTTLGETHVGRGGSTGTRKERNDAQILRNRWSGRGSGADRIRHRGDRHGLGRPEHRQLEPSTGADHRHAGHVPEGDRRGGDGGPDDPDRAVRQAACGQGPDQGVSDQGTELLGGRPVRRQRRQGPLLRAIHADPHVRSDERSDVLADGPVRRHVQRAVQGDRRSRWDERPEVRAARREDEAAGQQTAAAISGSPTRR